jgi:hypothetical protein
MAQLQVWTPDVAKRELARRLAYCMQARMPVDREMDECERALYNTRGGMQPSALSVSIGSASEVLGEGVDSGTSDVGVNLAFKNYRFIHSQLSANPPSVVPRPTSSDSSDKRKADAADRLVRYGQRKYQLQEVTDLVSANTLGYGTGFAKTIWDPDRGEIVDFDEGTGVLTMEGDISISVPSPRDVWFDPDAARWTDVKYVFEKIMMPWDEALFRFGAEQEKVLKKFRVEQSDQTGSSTTGSRYDGLERKFYDVVEVYQYWETGLPYNGQLGRFVYCTREGDLLCPLRANPFRFGAPRDRGVDLPGDSSSTKRTPERAALPYHVFTDIDVPGRVWGRSTVAYTAPLQDVHNRLVNVMIDCLQAHGVPRLLIHADCEIADDSVTNSPWDIVKWSGNREPTFQAPMQLPPAMPQILQLSERGINDMSGVNDSMFGKQEREQSGFSMQYATNQGNMIRRRLFNKYVLFVESMFKAYLNLVRKHWDETRTIWVLGKEQAFESVDLRGSDIDGGFDLVVEYGASLSLDPTARREEIITLMPLFEKAGMDPSVLMSHLKLNELEDLYDVNDRPGQRQHEEFQQIIETGKQVQPREMQDHAKRLIYCYQYVESSEFKYLAPKLQVLIEEHIKAREVLAAKGPRAPQGPAGPAGPAGAAGAGAPAGGLPAVPGPGGPLDVTQAGPLMANGA